MPDYRQLHTACSVRASTCAIRSPLIPFAHALFGATRYKADFDDDDFTCPDTNETAFAMALGAGLDIKASDRIDIRPIQVDYLPVFFDNRREDGIRFSAGVKIKN